MPFGVKYERPNVDQTLSRRNREVTDAATTNTE